jgi:tRNA1Val (adenine37-N6)-methyltransferase
MKVCTDACLFGAWLAQQLRETEMPVKHALDVGAGTGLLSLMIAQQNQFTIDALEINQDAYVQCKENTLNSPWSSKINPINKPLQDFFPLKKYDLIFSNPPFYEDDLKSAHVAKNQALHDTSLKLDVLVDFIAQYLQDDGTAALLIPHFRWAFLEKLLGKKSLYVNDLMLVKQSTKHNYFRAMVCFSKKLRSLQQNEMHIKDENGNYAEHFRKLLQEYYLEK